MKRYFLLFLLLPSFAICQVKTKSKKAVSLNETVTTPAATAGSYQITGMVTGYPDGTVVDLLNGYNGTPEASAVVNKGIFTFSGKADQPDLKVIMFNKQPPYLSLFLDNSKIRIKGKKDSIEKAQVTGSPANDQYIVFSNLTKPYQYLFEQNAVIDPVSAKNAAVVIEGFAKKYPNSHVTPLAILRHFQVSADADKMEEMFNSLYPNIKATPIGQYIAQQIAEAKKNPIGKMLPDFTQTDTAGKELRLSSLQGKYVLVDFWASWCGPCRQENPNVVNAYQKYKNKNFIVLGVSLDKSKKPWIDAIQMDNLTWPHVSDLQGWQNAVAQQYQIYSIPQNFLLDPTGKVIGKNLRGAALEEKLASVLK